MLAHLEGWRVISSYDETELRAAHTGVALWKDGELHLLHAPLVGRAVEISAVPLAERIKRIEKQDGIMVARPL